MVIKRGVARRLGLRQPRRLAAGGVVRPGQVWLVGEAGPQLLTRTTGCTVTGWPPPDFPPTAPSK